MKEDGDVVAGQVWLAMTADLFDLPNIVTDAFATAGHCGAAARILNAQAAHPAALWLAARTLLQPLRDAGGCTASRQLRRRDADFRSVRLAAAGGRAGQPSEGAGAARFVAMVRRPGLVQPERHGAMTGVMKAQIDWIPLSIGAVRPTQGKTLAVMQVSGGSQSFNAVNQLRVLGRWMRMITIPNQSSVAKAYEQFEEDGRMKAVLLLRPHRRCDGGADEVHAADARTPHLSHRPL